MKISSDDPLKQPKKTGDTPIVDAIMEEQVAKPSAIISSETMYNELVPTQTTRNQENLGVKALKQFHLKKPEMYDTHINDKIFSIG